MATHFCLFSSTPGHFHLHHRPELVVDLLHVRRRLLPVLAGFRRPLVPDPSHPRRLRPRQHGQRLLPKVRGQRQRLYRVLPFLTRDTTHHRLRRKVGTINNYLLELTSSAMYHMSTVSLFLILTKRTKIPAKIFSNRSFMKWHKKKKTSQSRTINYLNAIFSGPWAVVTIWCVDLCLRIILFGAN